MSCKKYVLAFLAIFGVGFGNEIGMELEIKPAYFHPQSPTVRKIYGGGYITLAEVSYTFYDNLYLWVEPGYFHKNGTFAETTVKIPTTLIQVPVSAGLGYAYRPSSVWEFCGQIGPNYLYTKTIQKSEYFKYAIKKHTFGGTLGISAKFIFEEHALLGAFINYRYDKKEVFDTLSGTRFDVYLGGFDFGGSFGVTF